MVLALIGFLPWLFVVPPLADSYVTGDASTKAAVEAARTGDILATAVPGFPVWDLGGLLGSVGWGLWVVALGGMLLRRPVDPTSPQAGRHSPHTLFTFV